jgi:hypothetical protein
MRKITRAAVITFVVIVTGLACQKAEVNPNQPSSQLNLNEHFNIENGRVNFKTSEDFKKQIEILNDFTSAELLQWNGRVGVNSLYELQLSTTTPNARAEEVPGNETLSEAVSDPHFASLLNQNGEFSIGTKIIRISPTVVFIADKSGANQVRDLNPSDYQMVRTNKFIVLNGIQIARPSHLSLPIRSGHTEFNGIDHSIYDWDDSHRSATVIYNDNWLIYRSIGTKVKFQNKRWWGGWWQL